MPITLVVTRNWPGAAQELCSRAVAPLASRDCTEYVSSAVMSNGESVDSVAVTALDLAHRDADLIDHMGAVRAEPAAALAGIPPPVGQLGLRVVERGHLQQEEPEGRRADHARRAPSG